MKCRSEEDQQIVHCHFNTEIVFRLIFINVKKKHATWHETNLFFAFPDIQTSIKPCVDLIYFAE